MAHHVSDHDKKYDRQMRLWGAHGQKALETAHICVLGSGPTAAETVKNLVLPSVGEFTLIDDAIITPTDIGNNFFVTEEELGQSRAKIVQSYLCEMNSDVKGHYIDKAPADVIEHDLNFFTKFNLIITCGLAEKSLRKLGIFLYERNIPLLIIKSYGLLGSLRLVVKEHLITESHPTNDRYDLFLHPSQLASFPELQSYCDSFILDHKHMDTEEHAHVPYAVILIQEAKKWRDAHAGQLPSTYNEKRAFKEQILAAAWAPDEVNFQEAQEFAHRVYEKPKMDPFVSQVFSNPRATHLTKDTPKYWFCVHGVSQFINNEGKGNLPVSQDIPDMHSKTTYYVKLKEIFKAKAESDIAIIIRYIHTALQSVGLPVSHITDHEIIYFVKNVRSLRVIATRSLEDEYQSETVRSDDINELFEEEVYVEAPTDPDEPIIPNPKVLHWYFALRAAESFHTLHGRYPGTTGQPCSTSDGLTDEFPVWEADVDVLYEIQSKLFKEYKINTPVERDCLIEIARVGATEIHNVASYMGGVGSQEALKVLLRQYVPINNTVIWNGIHCSSLTFQF